MSRPDPITAYFLASVVLDNYLKLNGDDRSTQEYRDLRDEVLRCFEKAKFYFCETS